MNFAAKIKQIREELSFNLLYAPDYPDDEETSLDREEQRIRAWIAAAIETSARAEDVGDWLRLSDQAVVRAFECFRKGEEVAGSRAIEAAIEYLESATSRKPFKADFIAKFDGTIERAPE